jgi:hypothetical protein
MQNKIKWIQSIGVGIVNTLIVTSILKNKKNKKNKKKTKVILPSGTFMQIKKS